MAKLRPGSPYPLGATWDGLGVNFALFSEQAERVELCLFDSPDATTESRRIPVVEQTDQVWHVYLSGVFPGQLYGYRVYGRYAPAEGLRFNLGFAPADGLRVEKAPSAGRMCLKTRPGAGIRVRYDANSATHARHQEGASRFARRQARRWESSLLPDSPS